MVDAYRIGVTIALVNNVSAVLGVISRDVLGLNSHVKMTEANLARMGTALGGLAAVGIGVGTLSVMQTLVNHGKELVHQQELYRAALKDSGLTGVQVQQDLAAATAQAWKTAHDVQTTTVAENMQNIRELRMVFGDSAGGQSEALKNLTAVATAKAVMSAVTGKPADEQVFAMAKALEIKGVSMDPEHFAKMLNDMVKVAVASGGKVLGTDFQSAFKFGRTATQGWSDDFVKSILPTLIQELKGGGGFGGATGPGNALQSAFQAVVGGVMSNKAAEEYIRLGMIQTRDVIRTTTGSIKGIRPGGVEGSKEFQADPYQWVQDVLVPALNKKGITDPDKVREEVAHLFVNRTAQQIVTLFATQQQRFQKDAALIDQAGGSNTLPDLVKHDPTTEIKAFKDAWDNLLTALGTPLVHDLYDHVLPGLTGALQGMTAWAAKPENQKAIENIELATAAFAGLMVVGGAMTIAKVALGPFTAGIRMLVGVMAAPEVTAAASGAATLSGAVVSATRALVGLSALAGLSFAIKGGTDLLANTVDQTVTGRTDAQQAAHNKTLDEMHEQGWEQFKRWIGMGETGPGPDLSHAMTNKPVGATLGAVPPAVPSSSGQPIPVIVTNGDELAGHNGAAIANGISSSTSRPPAGPSGYDTRMGIPPASLGIPQ
jgi:hypothetical protein